MVVLSRKTSETFVTNFEKEDSDLEIDPPQRLTTEEILHESRIIGLILS